LELAERETHDLMLADLGLPDISGIELSREVKLRYPDVQIALVTGWGVQLDMENLKQNGISGVVAKPYTRDDISAMIVKLLSNRNENS